MNMLDFKLTINSRSEQLVNSMKLLENIESGKELRATILLSCGDVTLECPKEISREMAVELATERRDFMRSCLRDML